MAEILENIRVLDFGRYIAGTFCGALLLDRTPTLLVFASKMGDLSRDG